MKNATDYFQSSDVDENRDRKEKEDKTAYQLKREIVEIFKKEFDEFKEKLEKLYNRRARFENIWLILIFSFLISSSFLAFCHYHNVKNRMGLSLPEFRERMKFDFETDENKALYFLFYITEVEKLKKEMSPEIISERLYDIANSKITGESIKNYFASSNDVIESEIVGKYRITSEARVTLSKKAGINLDYIDKSIFKILSDSFWFNEIIIGIGILSVLIVGVFAFGFSFGKEMSF